MLKIAKDLIQSPAALQFDQFDWDHVSLEKSSSAQASEGTCCGGHVQTQRGGGSLKLICEVVIRDTPWCTSGVIVYIEEHVGGCITCAHVGNPGSDCFQW
jgi:hypothetical protein